MSPPNIFPNFTIFCDIGEQNVHSPAPSGTYSPDRYEKLDVLPGTLEDEARFSGFKDMVNIVPLYRGRGDKAQLAGEFKVRPHICKEADALSGTFVDLYTHARYC